MSPSPFSLQSCCTCQTSLFRFYFFLVCTHFSFGAVLTLVEAICGSLGTLLPKLYVSSFVCLTVGVRCRSPIIPFAGTHTDKEDALFELLCAVYSVYYCGNCEC